MESPMEEETASLIQNSDVNDSESSENFQKFITELFEKNGILNDLRAYLRGHIVDVLKNAETGAPPSCQKHFTQRLELIYQALNILVAEYLLRLEFSYSFSVFVSEIPLANMVFDFARNLIETMNENISRLRFNENDVWSVLYYLGIKCDSVHAAKIIELYKCGDSPLLCCILKCIPMYHNEPISLNAIPSEEYLSSSSESCELKSSKQTHRSSSHKCTHYAFCKTCQNRTVRLRERYKRRKIKVAKNVKQSSVNPIDVETFMKSVNVVERRLIDEMFEQLKTVYEAEVEMVREEERRKIERSIENHASQLLKHRQEMEESYKAREAELECNVQKKKKFLWRLARALRDQHEHMTLAMRDVQHETQRLADKESNLKIQLQEAEDILKKRGEEMRTQISQELIVLEQHLEAMKIERDSINKERDELENLKNTYETKIHDVEGNVDFKTHYNSLKDEMLVLMKYIESMKETKCFIEKGTVTDLGDGVMNNESVGVRSDDDDRLKGSQVINDLKKQKNVNFSQSNLDEIYRQLSREPSRSIAREDVNGSQPGCANCNHERLTNDHGHICDGTHGYGVYRDTVSQLRDENDRLKASARQQRAHIEALSCERDRLQSRLVHHSRPFTAPSVMGNNTFSMTRVNPSTSANAFGSRNGAGEELNLFPSIRSRVLLPGDTVPFIGALRDRHTDTRRHLISQWRALRRRLSPHTHPHAVPACVRPHHNPHRTESTGINKSAVSCPNGNSQNGESYKQNSGEMLQRVKPTRADKLREKSPKSVLREAKENLKSNTSKETPAPRDKSPNAVLREAKMRLRKLEIEAEAVEKSYLDFRKRQSELKEERQNLVLAEGSLIEDAKQLGVKESTSSQRLDATINTTTNVLHYDKLPENMTNDFDKYLRAYQTKFDIGRTHFQNKNSTLVRIKPIPESYSKIGENKINPEIKNANYLETPLIEFRKFYQTPKFNKQSNDRVPSRSPISSRTEKPTTEDKPVKSRNEKHIKDISNETEVDISNSDHKIADLEKLEHKDNNLDDKENRLMIEVENVRETNNIGVIESKQDLLLVVESSVDNKEFSSETKIYRDEISTQMTIIISPKKLSKQSPKESKPYNDMNKEKKITELIEDDTLNATKLTKKGFLSAINLTENDISKITKLAEDKTLNTTKLIEKDFVDATNITEKVVSKATKLAEDDNIKATKLTEDFIDTTDLTKNDISKATKLSDYDTLNATNVIEDFVDTTNLTENVISKVTKLAEYDTANAIFQTDPNKDLSSIEMQLELTNEHLEEVEKVLEEYSDDSSADVDNYNIFNSISEGDNNSPISLAKTSEDENFWNS